LDRQYGAIEAGTVDLGDVAERIRDLKAQRGTIEDQLAELRPANTVPIRLYTDEAVGAFQKTIRDLFLGEDRDLAKRYLKLFIEKMVVTLPRMEIVGRSEVVLAAMENREAV